MDNETPQTAHPVTHIELSTQETIFQGRKMNTRL
jgi:hypothetical protein